MACGSKGTVQQNEDQAEADGDNHGEAHLGTVLVLELPTPDDGLAVGDQARIIGDLLLCLAEKRRQVPDLGG